MDLQSAFKLPAFTYEFHVWQVPNVKSGKIYSYIIIFLIIINLFHNHLQDTVFYIFINMNWFSKLFSDSSLNLDGKNLTFVAFNMINKLLNEN